MDNSLLVSSLFPTTGSSTSGALEFFDKDSTLSSITKDLLNTKFNIEQPASSVSFSDDFRQYVADNVGDSTAAKLLADIDAIDRFNDNQQTRVENPTGQLIGSDSATKQTNILDLLA